MEERKELRTELREIRRKIFEAPTTPSSSTTSSVSTKQPEISVNVEKENAKNLDLNGNKINVSIKKPTITTSNSDEVKSTSEQKSLGRSITSAPKDEKKSSALRSTTSSKLNMTSVTRRSRVFETDDNNNSSKTELEPQTNGIKLKVQNQGNEAPALRARDPTDRAARRARRAQHQKEFSIDQGKTAKKEEDKNTEEQEKEKERDEPKPQQTSAVVIEAPKEEKKEESKETPKVKFNTSSLNVNENKGSVGASGLRRSGTWGGSKDRAANNIGKALNKFGGQVSFLFKLNIRFN